MATPLFRGNPTFCTFTIPGGSPITVTENGTPITLNIGKRYNYLAGLSVKVSRYFVSTTSFEAIVSSYDPDSGDIVLSQFTDINGNWSTASGQFNMVTIGQRGSKITAEATNPSATAGRVGDLHINTATGSVWIKS